MYEIVFTKAAKKQLKKIPKQDQQKISTRIQDLSTNPRPEGMKALQGKLAQFHRVRSGNYRVMYSIEDEKLIVLVVKIAHRKVVYEI